ncbi:MAG: HigA family addiction module antitoxin [Desulfobacteraceae bacterium]|nr:HigA family addiction module antidote protein [Pseudomonadota bacterium]MBU4388801.1 HigA family addiction module antidote protein [Pseudomonadota bacterium]MBU4413499.1 HigA family addiction module antidote protein [Pseudomonadota bacterium]MCG2758668.1 HigA family addiction module antitoxin [Desulfobacteraceae bacterium]
MIRIPTNRTPTHAGEMLLEEFLKPMSITQRELANAINVPYQRVNEIINGKRGITPSTALRLAKFFRVSPDFWMNIQLRWDLYFANKSESDVLKNIKPLQTDQIQTNKSSAQQI